MRVTGIARYAHVVNASAAKGADKKNFSICALIHKNDPQVQSLWQQQEAAKLNGFPSGFPNNGNVVFEDLAITEPNSPLLRDYMQLKASTGEEFGRPVLVDMNLQPIIDPSWDGSSAGRIVHIDVSEFTAYDKGSKGVKVYLNGIMDTGEMGAIPADQLSSKPTAESMFGDVGGAAPWVQQPAAPAAPAVPAVQQPAVPNMAPPSPMAPPSQPAQPQYVMTEKAQGMTREQLLANGQGWTDELLISNGLMLPPNGVTPSFG